MYGYDCPDSPNIYLVVFPTSISCLGDLGLVSGVGEKESFDILNELVVFV